MSRRVKLKLEVSGEAYDLLLAYALTRGRSLDESVVFAAVSHIVTVADPELDRHIDWLRVAVKRRLPKAPL